MTRTRRIGKSKSRWDANRHWQLGVHPLDQAELVGWVTDWICRTPTPDPNNLNANVTKRCIAARRQVQDALRWLIDAGYVRRVDHGQRGLLELL